jgi:hypothetical protein
MATRPTAQARPNRPADFIARESYTSLQRNLYGGSPAR